MEKLATKYVYSVKKRFQRQPSTFDNFCKILRNLIGTPDVVEDRDVLFFKLKAIFANHQDLLLGLNMFLPKEHEILVDRDFGDPYEIPEPHEGSDDDDHALQAYVDFANKIRKRSDEKNDGGFMFLKFCHVMGMFQKKEMTVAQVDSELDELFRHDPDLYVEFTRFEADLLSESSSSSSDDEEFDASGFEILGRGQKRKRENGGDDLYKEAMFVRESYMYEMDMLKQRLKSTLEKLSTKPEKIQEIFSVLDFQCIEHLYCGHGEEVIRSNPVHNATVVVKRLRQKLEELDKIKVHMKRIWDGVFQDIDEKRYGRCRRLLEDWRRALKIRKLD